MSPTPANKLWIFPSNSHQHVQRAQGELRSSGVIFLHSHQGLSLGWRSLSKPDIERKLYHIASTGIHGLYMFGSSIHVTTTSALTSHIPIQLFFPVNFAPSAALRKLKRVSSCFWIFQMVVPEDWWWFCSFPSAWVRSGFSQTSRSFGWRVYRGAHWSSLPFIAIFI